MFCEPAAPLKPVFNRLSFSKCICMENAVIAATQKKSKVFHCWGLGCFFLKYTFYWNVSSLSDFPKPSKLSTKSSLKLEHCNKISNEMGFSLR